MMRASAKKQTEARAGMARGINRNYIISVQSAEAPIGDENCIDYVFIDPPFGANLNYSELNFMWESWLRVWTNNTSEAIENKVQKKDIDSYRQIMTCCLASAYKVLKPGKWITIEFSNTSAIVWNNIQTSLVEAGFIVANVSALDKQKGSFKALTSPTAVKQDLVISAYKPHSSFESRFAIEAGSEEGVWDFIRNHLSFLPVVKYQNHELQPIPERDPRILYDRMLSFYVRRGLSIPLSSAEFQKDLLVHFAERDEMIFLQEQAAEYDQARSRMGGIQQQSLFIFDESSAIQWIRRELKNKPQLFSDINHLYMQNIGGWSKSEVQLDLRELLNQNFLCYEGGAEVPPQITSWLRKSSSWRIEIEKEVLSSGQLLDQLGVQSFSTKNQELRDFAADHWYVPNPERQADLQRMRETSLLKQFQSYVADTKKIKVSRAEAIRAGFKDCWRRKDYGTIISIGHLE
jgi:hypothetical protein